MCAHLFRASVMRPLTRTSFETGGGHINNMRLSTLGDFTDCDTACTSGFFRLSNNQRAAENTTEESESREGQGVEMRKQG